MYKDKHGDVPRCINAGERRVRLRPTVSSARTGEYDMGFPSPASDYVEGRIDLNKVLMPHPTHMLMIEKPVGFAIVDRTVQGKTGDKVTFQLGDYSQLGRLFSAGIITSDGETIDGQGLEGIIVLGKVTAEVVSVHEPSRPTI